MVGPNSVGQMQAAVYLLTLTGETHLISKVGGLSSSNRGADRSADDLPL